MYKFSDKSIQHFLRNGIEQPVRMVQFLRTIARSLHLLQECRDDGRALDELRAVVKRGFKPVSWNFGAKWHDLANELAEYRGMVPLTLQDL